MITCDLDRIRKLTHPSSIRYTEIIQATIPHNRKKNYF